KKRMQWFIDNRPDLTGNMASMQLTGAGERRLLSIVHGEQLKRILKVMLDESEFLSPYGIRALSRYHKDHPYSVMLEGHEYSVSYQPAESTTGIFGGNSNWRGPIWFPLNYLLIEALRRYHHYVGDDFKVECPTGSGKMMTLREVSDELAARLTRIFQRDKAGSRPVFGANQKLQTDPHWRDYLLFHEYFHGDTGAGLGASHQTGRTA